MIGKNSKLIDITRLSEFLAQCKLLFATKNEVSAKADASAVYTKAEVDALIQSVKDSITLSLETGHLEIE